MVMGDTTTDAPVDDGAATIQGVQVDDQGMAVAQPEETDQAEAVEQPTKDKPTKEEVKEEPSTDDNSKIDPSEWLKKKGIDPTSPEAALKVAEMAANAEKQMHEATVKASQLEKTLDTGITEEAEAQGLTDDERLDIVRIKTKLSVREFFDAHPEAKSLEPAMIEELKAKPHLAGDLESLYASALVKSGSLDSLKSQGKREGLESLARTQQAAVPTGNATTSGVSSSEITPENVDRLVGEHDLEWFQKNQKAINKAMAG